MRMLTQMQLMASGFEAISIAKSSELVKLLDLDYRPEDIAITSVYFGSIDIQANVSILNADKAELFRLGCKVSWEDFENFVDKVENNND